MPPTCCSFLRLERAVAIVYRSKTVSPVTFSWAADGAESEGDSDDNASNGAAPTSAGSPGSQPQMWMVSVPVELRGGGPLSTTRMGRKYTFCSWRLKPDRCVRMPAVLSGLGRGKRCIGGWGEPAHNSAEMHEWIHFRGTKRQGFFNSDCSEI